MPPRDDLDPQERRKRTMRPALLREQVQAIEVGKLAQAMRYGEKDFEQDWELAQAIALLMAGMGQEEIEGVMVDVRGNECMAGLLEATMNRIIAFNQAHSMKVWAIMSGRVDQEMMGEWA
jgi:hypothetical protein